MTVVVLLCSLPIKFLLAEESWVCFQAAGQAIRTVLCFIPPSPADWMSRENPSRRLDDTTTWEKPLVRSTAMAAFKFCRETNKDGRVKNKKQGQNKSFYYVWKWFRKTIIQLATKWKLLITLNTYWLFHLKSILAANRAKLWKCLRTCLYLS